MELMEVKIRFNTNYPERSDKKWRLLVFGTEKLVDEIILKCQSYTSTDTLENGVIKYHISALCSQVKYEEANNQIKAILL